jgi:putative PIN family toxin of toxin-antitoxin system
VRAVLDTNVLISAVLSRHGSPARLLVAWQAGAFELIVSPLLLAELRRAFAYPKLRLRVPPQDADAFVDWLARTAIVADDPGSSTPTRSADPGDDYLLALAAAERAVLVSGDAHLTSLADRAPIHTPAAFLTTVITAETHRTTGSAST